MSLKACLRSGAILYETHIKADSLQNEAELDFGGAVHDYAHVSSMYSLSFLTSTNSHSIWGKGNNTSSLLSYREYSAYAPGLTLAWDRVRSTIEYL